MSNFLLRIEAIDAKVLLNCCPRGTPGRLHSLRLKRRFQQPVRSQSTATSHIPSAGARRGEPQISKENGAQQADGPESPLKSRLSSSGERPRDTAHWQPPRYHAAEKVRRGRFGQTFYTFPELNEQAGPIQASAMDAARRGMEHGTAADEPAPTTEELHEVLQANDPYAALRLAAQLESISRRRNDGLREFAELPASTLSQFLQSVDPEFFFAEYMHFEKTIPKFSPVYNSLYDPNQTNGSDFFVRAIAVLVKLRLRADEGPSLSDYEHVLQCARFAGSRKLSSDVWKDMSNNEVLPNTACYNHYLATMVHSDLLVPEQRQKVRVTPRNLSVRARMHPPPTFQGYKTGVTGLKYQVTRILDEMASNGIVADEETMCMIMTGLAKEGDLDGVKSMLDEVWGIHVEKFLSLGEADIGRDFPAESPVKPSPLLLNTLAYTLGINNSIPLALRLLDFVSRRYSLAIPRTAWEELLERTFVLDLPGSEARNQGFAEGSLPINAVPNLWNTFTQEPYNVRPSMPMYDLLIRNLLHQQRFGEALARMEETRAIHREGAAHYALLGAQRRKLPPRTPAQELRDRDSRIWLASLQVHRNRQYIRQWVRQLIHARNIKLRGLSGEGMHMIIKKWMAYLPRYVEYRIPTGTVCIQTGSEVYNKQRAKKSRAGQVKQHVSKDTSSGQKDTKPKIFKIAS